MIIRFLIIEIFLFSHWSQNITLHSYWMYQIFAEKPYWNKMLMNCLSSVLVVSPSFPTLININVPENDFFTLCIHRSYISCFLLGPSDISLKIFNSLRLMGLFQSGRSSSIQKKKSKRKRENIPPIFLHKAIAVD